jgi:hypothetical protein
MSFSASTCLSYTGTTTLTEPISIYTFSDVFITAVTLNQITNCPLVLTGIPDGTTTIKLKSANFYCCDVPLTCNDLCTTCDLSFDSYSTSLISRIVAGNLIGSCQPSISEYKINWYKSPDFTTPIFTSGYGTEFIPYNYTHPLTGATSPMTIAGTYTPIIDKVKLNGLNYSQDVVPGFIQANLECFNSTTVEVQAYRCDNGTESGIYTHRVQFSGASAGVAPLVMSSTFEISATTTNYFPWKFAGFAIPDTLTLTYYGSHYNNNPIILEKWVIGNNTNTNINLLTLPKSGKTTAYFSKVTSLTSLIRNTGDYVKLEVTPNPNNPQTNWDFYFGCKIDFDCDLCIYDYLNTPYKIQTSSITGITGSCSSINVKFNVSGCTLNSINNSDLLIYSDGALNGVPPTRGYSISTDNTTQLVNRQTNDLDWLRITCTVGWNKFTNFPVCSPSNTNTITFSKTNTGGGGQGLVEISFNNLSDFSAYYSSYLSILQYSGTPSTPSLTTYYRWYELQIPIRNGSEICGDNTLTQRYQFHYSSVLTTGFTSGNYTITITMPTITNGMPPYDPCDINCQVNHNQMITTINGSSTGSTNIITSMTSNTGSRYLDPFGSVYYYIENPPTIVSADTINGFFDINDWLNITMPFSGNTSPFTPIPSLSASTCNNYLSAGNPQGIGTRRMYMYSYQVILTDPGNIKSYQILAKPIINGVQSSTFSDTVATVVNGSLTYANPLYTF